MTVKEGTSMERQDIDERNMKYEVNQMILIETFKSLNFDD